MENKRDATLSPAVATLAVALCVCAGRRCSVEFTPLSRSESAEGERSVNPTVVVGAAQQNTAAAGFPFLLM